MSFAGFRRQFTYPYITTPYYEDFTDPGDFIVYSNDIGAGVIDDDLTGFSTDGTYYIRYDFTGGVVDSDNAGMWIEYRYERSNGGADRSVDSRYKLSPFTAASSWASESFTGTSATEIFVSAVMTIPYYIGDLKNNIGPEDTEDKVPGTWSIKRTISGPVNNSSDVLVCEFELRTLAVKNLRCEEPVFDPCSENNYTTIKADILALPPGWEPDSLSVFLQLSSTNPLVGFDPLADNYSLTPGSPDSNGKVFEVEIQWDGTMVTFSPSDGTTPLATEPVEGIFDVRMNAFGAPNAQSFDKMSKVKSLRCACRCPGSHVGGSTFFTLPLSSLVGSSFGPAMAIALAYCTSCSDAAPSSMGYGWRSNSSCRVFEDGTSGAIAYRNEVGNYQRWIVDGTDYVATTSDNLIKISKEMDPDATYVLTFPDQSVREFDDGGLLKRDVDRNGNALTYDYDSGTLASMTDAAGNVTSFDYTGRTDGQPVAVSSGGRTLAFAYNGDDQLESVTDPESETTSFVYNEAGLLWKILDTRDEEAVVFEYDEDGRITSETSYGLKKVETFYDDNANTIFDGLDIPSGAYGYYHRTVRVETDLTDEEAPVRTVALAMNSLGAVVVRAEKLDEETVNTTFYEYTDSNHSHLLTKVIQPNGSVTEMGYNERGDLAVVTDNNGNQTYYFYTEDVDEAPFNPKWAGLVRQIQEPSFTVDNVLVAGPSTFFEYDTDGNLIKVIDALTRETNFDVRSDGLVEAITDRRGNTTTMTYRSGDNRLETVTTPSGPDGAPSRTYTFDYDDFGNVTSVKDPLNREITREYDGNDRLTRVTNPLGKYVDYGYVDGRLETISAPANAGSSSNRRTSNLVYDDANRLIRVEAEIASSSFQKRVGYAYDGFSQLRALERLKDSEDKATAYSYDRLGRLISADDFLARTTSVDYAPFCVENTVTSPRGIRTKSSYDSLCQLTQIDRQDAEDNARHERVQYSYDELGRLISVTKGCLYKFEEDGVTKGGAYDLGTYASTTTFTYDLLGQVLSVNRDGAVTSYHYDEEGNVDIVTHPTGTNTYYAYYNDGRLKTVTYETSFVDDWTFEYAYDEAGQLLTITYPSSTGLVATFTKENEDSGWDDNGQLLCLRYLKNDEHFQRFEYSYDDSGNRIQFIDTPEDTGNQVTWDYGYDWLNRLTSVAKDSVTQTLYAYDESDNRIELEYPQLSETWTYTYDIADQLMETARNSSFYGYYEHDDDGNMTYRDEDGVEIYYDWDMDNRLVRIRKTDTPTVSQSYDADGIRRSRREEGGQTSRFFSSGGMSLSDTRPSGPVSFIQGHQLLGLDLVNQGPGSKMRFFVTDGLGSVRLVVSEDGSVVGGFENDEFGKELANTAPDDLAGHSFTGALGVRRDSSSLFYMRQRYYSSSLGRWLSADPIGFQGGLNLYGYCKQNPMNLVDPNGLDSWVDAPIFDNWWVWQGIQPGPYGDSNHPGEWADLRGEVQSYNDPVCSFVFDAAAVTGTVAGVTAGGLILLEAAGGPRLLVEGYKRRGGRICGIRPKGKDFWFRLDRHPLVRNGPSKWHYHRWPDLKLHRPWEGF